MKKITTIVLLILLFNSAFCQANKTQKFDFVARQVEENYAGFPSKVVDTNKDEYEKLKQQLYSQIELDNRNSDDAIGQYIAWFDDFHLAYGQYSLRYMPRNYKFYNEIEYKPQSVHTKVDERTYLIRISSFDGDPSMGWVKGSIKQYLKSGCENLILDIRGNGGGADDFVEPYIELLYDNPGFIYGVEIRNTTKYHQEVEELSKKYKFLHNVYQTMVASDDQFVTLVASDSVKYDKVSKYPIRAAVIIDKYVASSGEGLVVQLRASSSRTTIYGKDNTLGCFDFSNVTYIAIPGSTNILEIPMTRSLGLVDGNIVDSQGIAPDVRLDLPLPSKLTNNIDSWVLWVADDLKQSHK